MAEEKLLEEESEEEDTKVRDNSYSSLVSRLRQKSVKFLNFFLYCSQSRTKTMMRMFWISLLLKNKRWEMMLDLFTK